MARDVIAAIDLNAHGVLEAHAGTGKTYTIVGLVVRLLVERGLEMRQILLVTYTQKAAGELLERIRKGIESASRTHSDAKVREHLRANLANLHEALVGTIHGVCLRLLRGFPFESGLPFSTELVDDGEGVEICLREALRCDAWKGAFADGENFAKVIGARSMESLLGVAASLGVALLDESAEIHPPGLESMDEEADTGILAGAFVARWAREGTRRWNEKKRRAGFLSYQDMLAFAESAMDRPDFVAAMRAKVRVGIVDEFQDTSSRQWNIFAKWFLAPGAGNLFLVGDPKQSIYSFQGADVGTYFAARKRLMAIAGTRSYPLDTNWRSTPQLIRGYNSIFTTAGAEGWFLDTDIAYQTGNQALAPERSSEPREILSEALHRAPVRLVKLEGSAAAVRDEYARQCADWILGLRGRVVELPEGSAWKERTLDWSDFAIIASTRSAAKAFYRVLDERQIPWALYKQQGVFGSRSALEVAVVLRAIYAPAHDAGVRTLALATRLLGGDEEVLESLRELALARRWAQLVRLLATDSTAASRLLGASQGDREWMDLRQVLDYVLEYLLAGTGGLVELVEHLGRLADDREQASDDRNLLASATDRGRVQILTMHVSKGLEFPVVFLAGAGSNSNQGVRSWIGDGPKGPGLRLMPGFLKDDTKDPEWDALVGAGKALAARRQEQEARRLHYVALTRPELLLVVPCHVKVLKSKGVTPQGALAEAVFAQLDRPGEGVALLGPAPEPLDSSGPGLALGSRPVAVHSQAQLRALELGTRARLQASYTQVTKTTSVQHGLEGRYLRSEEDDSGEAPVVEVALDAWLPRGAHTGDALHEILEAWMDPQLDNSWLQTDPVPREHEENVARTLGLHGLDSALAPQVAALLVAVLRRELTLPDGTCLRLCDLAPCDRRPEVEFHWAFGSDGKPVVLGGEVRGWMVGYIDLLFRRGGKWYVLDWKTTSMDRWSPGLLAASVAEHSYDLQAKLYGRTVASALGPDATFGGAVVLYLRAFADPATVESGAWMSAPGEDGEEIARRLRGWLHERGQIVREAP